MIKLYIYSKDGGRLLYEDTGQPEFVIHDLQDGTDFTLTPPPDYSHTWRWIDNKWIADEQPS